MLAHEEGEG
jgi:hypothetical protein